MDTISLAKNMLTAATGAAKGHAKDLENYLKARVKLIADGTAAIAADRLKKKITKEDAKFAFNEIRESENTLARAVEATIRAAAQDAINAALDVAAKALRTAAGIAVP
jgi:septal ring factor EnvC (AmiA/AmiB activator)